MPAEDEATLVTDSALILEEESSDDGETLVQDRESHEQTQLLGELDARKARMHAIERASVSRPLPAGGRTPPMPGPRDPRLDGVPSPGPEADPERRMLPFASAMQAPAAPMAPPPMAYVAQGPPPPARQSVIPPPVAPVAPVVLPPVAPQPLAQPPAIARVQAHGTPPLAEVKTAPLPSPPAARPAFDSAIVAEPQGTPPFVIRFLAVCGLLTAAGLAVLIYLEI